MRAAVDAHEDVLVNILDRKAKIHELNKQITMGGKKRDRLTAQYHRKQSVPGMFELRDSALAVVQNALESVQVALELTGARFEDNELVDAGLRYVHSMPVVEGAQRQRDYVSKYKIERMPLHTLAGESEPQLAGIQGSAQADLAAARRSMDEILSKRSTGW